MACKYLEITHRVFISENLFVKIDYYLGEISNKSCYYTLFIYPQKFYDTVNITTIIAIGKLRKILKDLG